MILNEDNFLVFAMNCYDRSVCHSMVEFEDDVKKFLYLRKLILRYKRDNDLKERLILNHIIILYNVFGSETTKMLFYKIDKECWDVLVTFLTYLQRMPNDIPEYGISSTTYKLDEKILSSLRLI